MRFLITVILTTSLLACAGQTPRAPLIDELGGVAGVERIVDNFLVHLSEDEVIVNAFADTDIAALRSHLIDQICEVAGGDCVYTGRTMKEAHEGLDVDSRQFNALVADLIAALNDEGVPTAAQNRLLGRLAPMHADMVH